MEKYALVTGGTRGIGLGISKCLAIDGFNIAINGVRDEFSVSEVIKELRSHGKNVIYCQGDIGEEDDRFSILDKVLTEFGQIDVLVNNAGVAPKQRLDILETTVESYDHVMGINLKGTFFLSQAVAKQMILKRQQGAKTQMTIINISSVSATMGSPDRSEYCISKAGIGMLTSLLAIKLAANDIEVFEIRPGLIDTDMTAGVKEKYDKLIEEGLVLQQRWGKPEDIGRVVVYLASGDLAYSTGQVLTVDGGLSIPRL